MGDGKLEDRSREPPVRTLFGGDASVFKLVKATSAADEAAPLQGAGFLLPAVWSGLFELTNSVVVRTERDGQRETQGSFAGAAC